MNDTSEDFAPINETLPSTKEENTTEPLDPDIISYLAPDFGKEDYKTGISKLKELYENNNWVDKELAAQNVSKVADVLNKKNQVTPEFSLDSDAVDLSNKLLDTTVPKDLKIDAIEHWREDAKRKLYSNDSIEPLIAGTNKEELIDQYAMDLRRNIVAGNRGFAVDSFARGAEGVLSPLAGASDAILGTDLQKSLRSTASDYKNPARDDSVIATAASIGGTILGAAVSTLNPVTAYGYLGAIVTSQAKDVYDTALKETKSTTAAQEALINSSPGIVLGAVSDRIVGGTLGKFFKGEQGATGVIANTVSGAVGNVAEVALTGQALAQATGNTKFLPTKEELQLQAIIGGSIGFGIGALGRIKHEVHATRQERQITKAREEFERAVQGTDKVVSGPSFSANYVKPTSIEEPTTSKSSLKEPQVASNLLQDSILESAPVEPPGSRITPEAFILKNAAEQTPPRTVIPVSQGFTPSALVQEATRRLDGFLGVKDLPAGFYGFYDPTTNDIVLNRSIFKDPNQAQATLAHEFGHFYDYYRKAKELELTRSKDGSLDREEAGYLNAMARTEDVLDKLAPIHDVVGTTVNRADVAAEAKQLSLDWRPPLTPEGGNTDYRNSSVEIQADAFSALINNPALVQSSYPKVWEAFELGLQSRPELNSLWNEIIDLNKNPEKVLPYTIKRMQEGRLREAHIVKGAAEKDILDRRASVKESLVAAKVGIKQKVINRYFPAREIVDKTTAGAREQAFEAYNNLYRGSTAQQQIDIEYDIKAKRLFEKAKALGVTDADWDVYEKFNRILNETTETIENIKQSPDAYREAGMLIDEAYSKIFPVIPRDRSPLKDLETIRDTKDLVDTLGQIHGGLFDKNIRAQLLKHFTKIENTPLEVFDLLKEGEFNVRGKLANPDVDYPTAERGMGFLKQQLGEEGFKNLETVSREFHDIVSTPLFKSLEESGILSDKTMKRLKLNKSSYVTYNVLDFYENDPRVSATIRQQLGTFRQIGDARAATFMKSKAIFARSERQISENNAINIARQSDYGVKLVEPEVSYVRDKKGRASPKSKNVYDQQEKLQKENPDKSYMVYADKGLYSLYEIDTPLWNEMFAPAKLQDVPVLGAVLKFIEGFNRLFRERELKTIWSPVFAFRQRWIDTQNEAIFARKATLPGLPFHLNKEMRAIKAEGYRLFDLAKQGEYTPETKALTQVGALPFNHGGEYGGGEYQKAEHAIYERLGVPIPKEAEAYLADRISKKLSSQLDKTFFGKGVKAAARPVQKGAEKVREFAERDEGATKIAGYLIAKDIKGMSDAEAMMVAREWFGTPDTYGGGTEAASLNKLFMFGRAHVNGLRAVANQFKDDPKGYSFQYGYYKLLPKVLVSSSIMVPLISSIFGEEEGAIAKLYLDKIPEFDKASKNIVPIGFADDKGNFKGFNVSSKEVTPEWKAKYLRLPQARELFTLDTLINPQFKALEELIDTGTIDGKHFAQNWSASLGSAFLGNVSPAILGAVRTSQLIGGYNPHDYYRNRGVLPKDVAEAGSFLEKTYSYLGWSLAATAPGVFTSGLKPTATESLDPFDYAAKLPIAGSMLKGFIGSTNYGDYEMGLKGEQAKKELDSSIRLNLGDNSKKLYNDYTKYHSLVSRIGKGWEGEVGPKLAGRIHAIYNWHSRVYQHAFNNMRANYEKADAEEVQKISDNLEQISSSYLQSPLINE